MTQVEFELSEQRRKELENITISDIGHVTLDTIGLVPVLGEPTDVINAAWYLKEGDYTNAAISGAAALPILGWEATGAKYGYKAVKSIDEAESVVKWSEKVDSDIFINSNRVRHSQKIVSYRKSRGDMEYTYDDIKYSMEKEGWKGEPIDVVEMPDGGLTSIDNTRVRAAKETGIKVKANVRKYDEQLPDDILESGRFNKAKLGQFPKTWGEAVTNRIKNQGSKWSKENPHGTHDLPRLTGKPNE